VKLSDDEMSDDGIPNVAESVTDRHIVSSSESDSDDGEWEVTDRRTNETVSQERRTDKEGFREIEVTDNVQVQARVEFEKPHVQIVKELPRTSGKRLSSNLHNSIFQYIF
jgi:hypothetical protein